jgi:hypothetical protein
MRTFWFLTLAGGMALSGGIGAAAEPPQPGPCVDVQVGTEHISDLDCINQNLRTMSARQQGVPQAMPQTAPVDAHSSSTAVGTANQAAAREMMGNAFGKSATPQRPPSSYVNPLIGGAVPH